MKLDPESKDEESQVSEAQIKALQKELEKTKLKLKIIKNRYNQIYVKTNTPIIEINESLSVLSVNKSFYNAFSYKKKHRPNFKVDDIKVWDLLGSESVKNLIDDIILQKDVSAAEIFACTNKNQETLLVQINVNKLSALDGSTIYQLVLNDLTTRIQEDKAAYQKEKLGLMEKMARTIAHEIRNPLTNIILSAEQLVPSLKKEDRLYTDIIQRNSGRIETLITKFLNTFKSVNLVKEPTDIKALAEHALREAKDTANLLDATLTSNIPNDLPKVPLDKEKIDLVLSNLINNGLQACSEVESAKIQLTAIRVSNHIEINIIDNGVGIDNEEIENIFEPFYTKKSNGLGLGLTTSLNIVRSHSGQIKIKGNETSGVTVSVILPILHDEDEIQ